MIEVSRHIYFDKVSCQFCLTSEAQNVIYRQKNVICSYSGSSEWANDFTCDMLDLYSGSTPYNYGIDSYRHKQRIPELLKEGKEDTIIKFILHTTESETFKKMYANIDKIIDDLDEV